MTFEDFIAEFKDDADYITAHTSGSTGKPKDIRLKKSDMLRSARASNARFGITAKSRLAIPLSADYIAGKMMAVRAIAAGCELTEIEPSNNLNLGDDFLDRPADLMSIVPGQAASLLTDMQLKAKVRQLLIGGAAITEEQCRALVARGIKVWLSYGMTETCSHVAVADGSDPRRTYRAMPGISFDTDADGRLIIKAPEFDFGTITANDIVELTDHYSFRWIGRSDDIINSGGIKLIPEQLEAEYAPILPAGSTYFVTSCPDKKWGRAVMLVFESDTVGEAEICALLRNSGIDHRHLPKYVKIVHSIKRTLSGKVVRKIP